MPATPDRHPGTLVETEEILLGGDAVGDPSNLGGMRYVSGNYRFRDAAGVFNPRTGSAGVTYSDFNLDNEPIDVSTNYDITYSGNQATQERWKRLDTTNYKTIDYTYTGNKVSTEVRKVYAADGTTVVAQSTVTYTYTGNSLTSATYVRNV